MRALDNRLPPVPSHEQSEQLLPLAESSFDDAIAYTRTLFGERLPDESLAVELLIAWVDHPQAWVQALGRARLVRRMSAELGGRATCVATGGLASIIAPETDLIEHVDVDLTLQGLRIVWERNR